MNSVGAQPGVLPIQSLNRLISEGVIAGADPARLQPASLDLAFGARAWRIRASFLPTRRRRVEDRLADGLALHEIDLERGAVFERGCVYLVELCERLALPATLSGAANPKSSTGRIDVFVRLVVDSHGAFDDIPAGYSGPLYAEVSPRSFSIAVKAGSSLSQLRLKSGECRLEDSALRAVHEAAPLIDDTLANIEGGLGLCVALEDPSALAGWRARRHAGLIDVDRVGALDPHDFFEPVSPRGAGFIVLDPDEFYILASKEELAIPPGYAAEMTPISPGLGEFRVHYAGFFDPGFGWSAAGDAGSRAVLEVRSRETPFILEDGQLVARLVYEKMAARPERLYGGASGSNYQGQTLKLSKHFR